MYDKIGITQSLQKPPTVNENQPSVIKPSSANDEDVKMTVTPYRKSSATPLQQSQEELPANEEDSFVEIIDDSDHDQEFSEERHSRSSDDGPQEIEIIEQSDKEM